MAAFETWAILEVMGHARFAGRVSEAEIGGSSFVRIDVPAIGDAPPFTKYFGAGAVYSLTPCTEETATAAAASFRSEPHAVYDLRRHLSIQAAQQRELELREDDLDPDPDGWQPM